MLLCGELKQATHLQNGQLQSSANKQCLVMKPDWFLTL